MLWTFEALLTWGAGGASSSPLAGLRVLTTVMSLPLLQGASLSVFDGVPFVVKDCIDALPYETSFGTKFMGKL